PLNLVRAAAYASLCRLAGAAVVRRAGQHRVLRRDPTQPTAAAVRWDAVLDARGDPHTRAAHLHQARTLRVHVHAELDLHRAQLVHLAAVVADHDRRHLPRIRSSSAVPSKNMYSGTNMISGVTGSTPGVRKFARSPSPRKK